MKKNKAFAIVRIALCILFAIAGALLGVNHVTGGSFIELRLTAHNTFDLLWQFILHCGNVGFIFPLFSIWRIYRIFYPKKKEKEN